MSQIRLILTSAGIAAAVAAAVVAWHGNWIPLGESIATTPHSLSRPQNRVVHTSDTLALAQDGRASPQTGSAR